MLAKVLALFGKNVADVASVTFELTARPKGAPGGGAAALSRTGAGRGRGRRR